MISRVTFLLYDVLLDEMVYVPLEGAPRDTDLVGDSLRPRWAGLQEMPEDVTAGFTPKQGEGTALPRVELGRVIVGLPVERFLGNCVIADESTNVMLDLAGRDIEGSHEFVEVDSRLAGDLYLDSGTSVTHVRPLDVSHRPYGGEN